MDIIHELKLEVTFVEKDVKGDPVDDAGLACRLKDMLAADNLSIVSHKTFEIDDDK